MERTDGAAAGEAIRDSGEWGLMYSRADSLRSHRKETLMFLCAVILIGGAIETSGTVWPPILVGVAFLVGYLPGLWGRSKAQSPLKTADHQSDGNDDAGYETLSKLASTDITESLDLINAGRQIEAIKHIRGSAGVGLKEAKDAAEFLKEFGASWQTKATGRDWR